MAYLFCVNETNRHICVNNRLFGVPATDRARSQILNVSKGDKLFLYVYGSGFVYGNFKAESNPFIEPNPEVGPWNSPTVDKGHGYYPYRISVSIPKLYEHGIHYKKLEDLNIGLSSELLQRKSVIYISDFQANIIEQLLSDQKVAQITTSQAITDYSTYESLYTKDVTITDSQEKSLQLLVQKHFTDLESGIKPVTSYFNIKYGTINGEIDVLARDKDKNFVVTELKAQNLKKDIWTQLLTYSHVIRDIYAKFEDVGVRSFIICPGFERKVFYAYPELKKLLKNENSLRIFQYETNYKDSIKFSEIPVTI